MGCDPLHLSAAKFFVIIAIFFAGAIGLLCLAVLILFATDVFHLPSSFLKYIKKQKVGLTRIKTEEMGF